VEDDKENPNLNDMDKNMQQNNLFQYLNLAEIIVTRRKELHFKQLNIFWNKYNTVLHNLKPISTYKNVYFVK